MSRQARKASASGIYHIMLRGINRQRIFEDREDEEKILQLLRSYKKRCGFALYAYCLMGNHIHLLLKEAANPSVLTVNGTDIEVGPGEPLEMVFKRLGVSYVTYYNRRHKRVGHLFQDRFKSEPVDSDEYLLMALRYIHRNPVKAGMCVKPEDYPMSSYHEYLTESENPLTDTRFVLEMITRDQLVKYTSQENEDRLLDMESENDFPKTEEEVKTRLLAISGCAVLSDFQRLEKSERKDALMQLYKEGATITQISRITGCSRTMIYRALRKEGTRGTVTEEPSPCSEADIE